MGAASGTLGRVPIEFQRRAPAQDRIPATTKTPISTLMRSSLTVSLQLPRALWTVVVPTLPS